ncbi:LysE family translocator [Streptomyces sp. NBRC 110028]|uniref:LysE family translocator n=1 Tax=Streptomyces sp. NBRC 110028 TaxID=1621260 RepID=UPI00351C5B93
MALTPGPNMIHLASRAITQGRRAGLVSLSGTAVGFVCYLLAAAAGLSVLFGQAGGGRQQTGGHGGPQVRAVGQERQHADGHSGQHRGRDPDRAERTASEDHLPQHRSDGQAGPHGQPVEPDDLSAAFRRRQGHGPDGAAVKSSASPTPITSRAAKSPGSPSGRA